MHQSGTVQRHSERGQQQVLVQLPAVQSIQLCPGLLDTWLQQAQAQELWSLYTCAVQLCTSHLCSNHSTLTTPGHAAGAGTAVEVLCKQTHARLCAHKHGWKKSSNKKH
jgi:hypothetical protein